MSTEKSYGGNNGVREHLGKLVNNKLKNPNLKISKNTNEKTKVLKTENSVEGFEDYKKAGGIAIKTRDFAKKLIKPGMPLLEIARNIENEIVKLGGEIAFPVNLSIDDVAAHYHPTIDDTTVASGLLKVDIGVHVNGFVADSAFSIDLSEDKKYSKLIEASQEALNNSLELIKNNPDSTLNEIGMEIQKTIQKKGFSPIVNLSGHSLSEYTIHAGITIPNYSNGNQKKLDSGAYAIEPFATTGEGRVIDGQSSNIFAVENFKSVRGITARKVLEYVSEKYVTLPFSLREIQEKFGPMARLALKELEQAGVVHNFPQLIEISHKPVSQAEHTFIKTPDGKIIITTR